MDQETMKFMHELQEFVHKAEKFLQSQGGNYGQREQSWMHGPHGYPEQPNWGGGDYPYIDPRVFM